MSAQAQMRFGTLPKIIAVIAGLGLTAGCTPNTSGEAIWDPYENGNRRTHEFNKALDRKVVSKVAGGGGGGSVPRPVTRGISNFADNLDRPRHVINSLLQGDVGNAVAHGMRFLVDSTFGLAGVLGASRTLGMESDDTDFGETLAVWGAEEGAYVELPFLGPSTERDTAGMVVDAIINPIRLLNGEERRLARAAGVAETAIDRQEFSGLVDDLYGSADSYAQARLLYLQNRRFELGETKEEDDYVDPYDELFE